MNETAGALLWRALKFRVRHPRLWAESRREVGNRTLTAALLYPWDRWLRP